MAKKDFFQRYKSILKLLSNKKYATYEEIYSYLLKELRFINGYNEEIELSFSKRTFQRDIKEIEQIWGFVIAFCNSNKGYYIDTELNTFEHNKRLFEILEIQNALQLAEDVKNVIFFEQRRLLNLHFIDDVVNAVRRKCVLKIVYKKFEDAEATVKKIEPYGVKEYKNRWYIIAKDYTKSKIKIYALDRVEELLILNDRFTKDESIDIEAMYKHVFGIFISDSGKVERVVLEFDAQYGNYIKTLPLHSSQQILKDDSTAFKISLELIITSEFIAELLSMGRQVTVISPLSLKNNLKKELLAMSAKYMTNPEK